MTTHTLFLIECKLYVLFYNLQNYKLVTRPFLLQDTWCSKKHGNSVMNSISSLLWISIVIPNFKSHNIVGKRLQRCVYNVSARWTVKTDKFTLFAYCNFLVLLTTTKHKQTKCEHSRRNSYRLQLSQ